MIFILRNPAGSRDLIIDHHYGRTIHLHDRATSRSSTARGRCSRTSGWRFTPAPRSACIGGNGAGKSTLLRIMAGVDKDFIGTARLAAGFTIGFCRRSRG